MYGVQGLAVALICYLIGPGLAAKSSDPVLVGRIFKFFVILTGGGGVVLLLIAFLRKN